MADPTNTAIQDDVDAISLAIQAGDDPRRAIAGQRGLNRLIEEIARLRADARLMALALRGVTPDANTQTGQEIGVTEGAIEAAVKRALS